MNDMNDMSIISIISDIRNINGINCISDPVNERRQSKRLKHEDKGVITTSKAKTDINKFLFTKKTTAAVVCRQEGTLETLKTPFSSFKKRKHSPNRCFTPL